MKNSQKRRSACSEGREERRRRRVARGRGRARGAVSRDEVGEHRTGSVRRFRVLHKERYVAYKEWRLYRQKIPRTMVTRSVNRTSKFFRQLDELFSKDLRLIQAIDRYLYPASSHCEFAKVASPSGQVTRSLLTLNLVQPETLKLAGSFAKVAHEKPSFTFALRRRFAMSTASSVGWEILQAVWITVEPHE